MHLGHSKKNTQASSGIVSTDTVAHLGQVSLALVGMGRLRQSAEVQCERQR